MYEYQSDPSAGLGFLPMLVFVAAWAYVAWCQMKMAQKLGLSNKAWWAWIPVLNLFLLCEMAGKPAWWFILCLIPLVGLIPATILWMKVSEGLGQSPAWGIVMVWVPVINLFALAKLAFSAPPRKLSPPPSQPAAPQQPRQPQNVG